MQKIFVHIAQVIDDILFPKKCLVCKKTKESLCKNCSSTLPQPERDLPKYIFALYEYRHPIIKKVLTDAKYRKRFEPLYSFGAVLSDAATDIASEYVELNNYSNIFIVPVPISKKRMHERGFNQALVLAKALVRNNKSDFKILNNIILKIKDKTPQASIHNRNERLQSPVGTFAITTNKHDLAKLQGSFCIIIDDITTTGATISEVRRILIDAGAQTAIGLTVAH